MDIGSLEVPHGKLTKVCNPDDLGFETTEQVPPLQGTIGQERAVEALEFGLGIDAPDFNVFVSGLVGTGRNATLRAYLERVAVKRETPRDWGYVYNFQDPSRPMAISLPCGMVQELAKDIGELVESCQRDIPGAFESESYQHKIEEAMGDIQAKKTALYSELQEEANKSGYTIDFTPAGIVTIPLKDGRQMSKEEYAALPEEERNQLKEKRDKLQHFIQHRISDIRRLDKEATQQARENMMKYASFIADRCNESGLKSFHKTAVARVIDHSSRLIEHQDKLTTRFIDVSDLITEANYWAEHDDKSPLVQDKHVQKAIEQRIYRSSLPEDKLHEFIQDGTIHISTAGESVGQVNGLAILSLGDYLFGKPSRITARVSLGRGQVMNIERETQMSGPVHNKGFLILTGYLTGKYGQDKPLSLSASIGFEQTYDEVEGDSASSTELYALLSTLSGLPIKQNIAVTGVR